MSPASVGEEGRTAYHVNLAEGAIDKPEQPEPLAILRELRRFNLPMWSGGYADQPHILMLELNCVIECELDDENIRYINALSRKPKKPVADA